MIMVVNTCALFGGANYANNWLGVNYLIIIIGFLLVSVIYIISKFLPSDTKGRISGITKVEVTQLLISAIIIAVIMIFATAACNVSTTLSQNLVGTAQQPFQYAEYYIGNLTFGTGFKLLAYMYSLSITYTIEGRVLTKLSVDNSYFLGLSAPPAGAAGIYIQPILAYYFDIPFYIAADFYLGLFSPLIIVAIGMLFLQFLLLPVIEFSAFTLILPLALIVRSVSYAGASNGLRNVGNGLLALSIALYIIYPMTIALDGYIIHWIFCTGTFAGAACPNPTYAYLQNTIAMTQIPSTFFSSTATQTTSSLGSVGGVGISSPSVLSLLETVGSLGISHGYFSPTTIPMQAQQIIDIGAQFLFQAVVLFALDLAITIAFAQSMARALNSGIEGAVQFWGG